MKQQDSDGTAVTTGKVLLVEDNMFNREGMALYLSRRQFEVLEAGDRETALALAQSHRPAVAVVDIVIPDKPDGQAHLRESVGAHLVVELKQLFPAMGIVLFSAYEDRGEEIFELLNAGIRGLAYKLKGTRPNELLNAILLVMDGGILIDAEVTNRRQIVERFLASLGKAERVWVVTAARLVANLSDRERVVAQRQTASYSLRGIGDALNISTKTVESHRTQIYARLGLDKMPAELNKAIVLAKALILHELSE